MGTILKLILSELWGMIIKPLFTYLVSRAGKDLWDTTVLAVEGAEADYPDASGVEKAKIVFDRVKQTMEAKGKEYPTSIYNLFRELAVAYVKKKLGL